jgi:caffeoyl-CoA O-methyltransferase
MDFNKEIDTYITKHTSPESEVLQSLNRDTNVKLLNPRMLSGHIQGQMLKFISCMVNPTYILEIGTFTGYSAICLAEGLKPNGELHTIEINDELTDFALEYFEKAGIQEKIKYHCGDALKIIPTINCGAID